MGTTNELTANELYRCTDPEQLNFETTDDLADLSDMVGQPRAAAATSDAAGHIGQQHGNISSQI